MTDPGLNLTRLAALRRPHPATPDLPGRIRTHLGQHDGYLAWSGGKDSTVVLHLALQADANVPVVFFDSGLEFPETYRYLALLRDQWRLKLHWIPARHTTLELLHASSAWDHTADRPPTIPNLHQVLISEPSARAHTDLGPGEIWGVRAEESRGRAALYATALRTETAAACRGCCAGPDPARARRRHHGGIVRRADRTVAYGPIWDWKTTDVWAYLARHHIPVNPVYDKLRALGAPEHVQRVAHMLDGSRLEHGRVTWLRRGWPDLFEDLAGLLPRLREFI